MSGKSAVLASIALVIGALMSSGPVLAASKVIAAAAGQTITISMPGNPTTGYSWQRNVSRPASKIIRLDGCGWQPLKGARGGITGAPAIFRCRITALKPGQARLEFNYLRPWETRTPPRATRRYLIRVR